MASEIKVKTVQVNLSVKTVERDWTCRPVEGQ